jgi:hypothetical protein
MRSGSRYALQNPTCSSSVVVAIAEMDPTLIPETVSGCLRPESMLLLTHVEYHVYPLHRHLWIHNHFVPTRQLSNKRLRRAHLLSNQRRDVRLNSSRPQPDDDHSHYQPRKRGPSFDRPRQRRQKEYNNPHHVHDREVLDGCILAQKLVGNNSPKNGSDVAPKLEEIGQRRCASLCKTESAGESVGIVVLIGHVVLEGTR